MLCGLFFISLCGYFFSYVCYYKDSMKNGLVSIVCYFSSWSLDETCTGIASAGNCSPRDFLFGSGPLFPTLSQISFPPKCSEFAVSALVGFVRS